MHNDDDMDLKVTLLRTKRLGISFYMTLIALVVVTALFTVSLFNENSALWVRVISGIDLLLWLAAIHYYTKRIVAEAENNIVNLLTDAIKNAIDDAEEKK